MDSKIIRREQAGSDRAPASDGIRSLMQSPEERMQQVFADAQTAGYRAGHEISRKEFLATTAAAVKAIRDEFFALEPMLGPLVLQAVQKVLGALPADEVARSALLEALREGAAGVAVTLKVAPDDVETMRMVWAETVQDRPELGGSIASIEGDASLRAGEMLMETLKGRTHIGIPYQLARLKYGVLGRPA